MLQSISWQTYFTICVVLLVIYYCAILALYYRQDIVFLLNKEKWSKSNFTGNNNYYSNQPLPDTGTNALSENLKDEINAYTLSAGLLCNKTELQYGMQLILRKYAPLKDSDIRPEIKNMIIEVCENNCSITLSGEEADMLWNG